MKISPLSHRDVMLVSQIDHFKDKLHQHTEIYERLILLSFDMAKVLSRYPSHHNLVRQWAALARELI